MSMSEQYGVEVVKHKHVGYEVYLTSNKRGQYIDLPESLVGSSGYLDLDFVGSLIADLFWVSGYDGHIFSGIGVCTTTEIEEITQLVAFNRWSIYNHGSLIEPSVRFTAGLYILQPRSIKDVQEMVSTDLLFYTYFIPCYPDTTIIIKKENEDNMFFVKDEQFLTLERLRLKCEQGGVGFSIVEPFEHGLTSIKDVCIMVDRLRKITNDKSSATLEVPIGDWFHMWASRFAAK